MANIYDRAAEDLGNIVNLGHVNHRVPDQRLATIFYISGLGLTRDPAMMTGIDNMWVNVGISQFHLPTGPAVVAPGIVTGLVVSDLAALKTRFERVAPMLKDTCFSIHDRGDHVELTCPWGNRIRCHAPSEGKFGPFNLGMAYVSFEIRKGQAEHVAHFYRDIMRANSSVEPGDRSPRAQVACGHKQFLYFQEMESPEAPCPDHHIQIYLADFSGPYRALIEAGADLEESNRYQYRFKTIFDPRGGEPLFVLDHEVRSMTHPMYNRPLVNRDPHQSAAGYRAGRDFHTLI